MGLVVEFIATALYPIPRRHRIRVHIGHVAERQGLWVMVLLGEAVFHVVTSPSLSNAGIKVNTVAYVAYLAAAFLLVFVIHLNYFGGCSFFFFLPDLVLTFSFP